jgi:ribosomal protein S18 acetylase RimI-like enzyme
MNIQVTDAIENDVERLIEVYSSPHLYHTREEASWYVKSFFDYHHIKVVKSDEVSAGWLFWRVESERHHGIAVIDELWVDEKFRRKGLGEKLLRTSIEDAKNFFKRDGFVLRKVLVTTAEDNEPAIKLYEKIGFQKSAVFKGLYGKGENEIVYILTLNP